jgi:hypothetical protein
VLLLKPVASGSRRSNTFEVRTPYCVLAIRDRRSHHLCRCRRATAPNRVVPAGVSRPKGGVGGETSYRSLEHERIDFEALDMLRWNDDDT